MLGVKCVGLAMWKLLTVLFILEKSVCVSGAVLGEGRLINNDSLDESTNLRTEALINPYNYSFILQSTPCTPDDKLLIVVHTSTKSVYNSRRVLMRATWLNKHYLSRHLGFQVKIVFFTGKSPDEKHQRRLEYESELYQDIVQSDFEDNYLHNTYKAMSYLLWTSKHCADASLLMKIDDDTLLRTVRFNILKPLLQKWMFSNGSLYAGKTIAFSQPVRDTSSKWYISRQVWPHDYYPLWFQGLVYFLTPRHTGLLFNTSLYTHYMHTDDVFIGIIVNKTAEVSAGVSPINTISKSDENLKYLKKNFEDKNVAFFHVPSVEFYLRWHIDDIAEHGKVCTTAPPAFQYY